MRIDVGARRLHCIVLCCAMMVGDALPARATARVELGKDGWITFGAGLRPSFRLVRDETPTSADSFERLSLESARLYVNGGVKERIRFEFNTERDGSRIRVLDSVAKLELARPFNVWAGRFLPPSDRSNLSGPYYLTTFDFPFVQAFPAIFAGRDDGAAVWGELGKGRFKYQLGAFRGRDGGSNVAGHPLYASRLTVDFWDPEPGYYNASTYYGDKDVLALGLVMQRQQTGAGTAAVSDDFSGLSLDGLLEKRLGNKGVATLESAYYRYDLGRGAATDPALVDGNGFFVLGGYLFPRRGHRGRLQAHFRAQKLAPHASVDHSRTDLGATYLIKKSDARVMLVESIDHAARTSKGLVLGLQFQF